MRLPPLPHPPLAHTRAGATVMWQPHDQHASPNRRDLLALTLLPLLLPARQAAALPSVPGLPSLGSDRVQTQELYVPDVCQARVRDQDFVVVTYVGRFSDGRIFDDRYAKTPLVYELGGFYLDGVDQALIGRCVGTKLLLTWPKSPPLRTENADELKLLPAGSSIEMEIEMRTIKYSLFGEKMRNPQDTYWFSPRELSLTSPPDSRGHLTSRVPQVKKDNPFSIAPNEKSLISAPSNTLVPLFDTFRGS
ncbi:hypothetical protein AB1Y20_009976 [Prymnesium parvum]|uniref:peptidylprolyl isomerase n=1 Tax=Prymnesium parvum TaxID=97485 RepID=A0AB34K5S9_PRYPA|mmetsp:Transcript_27940/g.69396  ORF Transcript_27940/g.69396 Transcript_27940/m.69396 type:complete len:249 (+) Transcript_27940:26-772(+)